MVRTLPRRCMLLVIGLMMTGSGWADNHCEPAQEELDRLTRETALLASQFAGLDSWLDGEPDHTHPISELFPIDPLNPVAVAQFRDAAADRARLQPDSRVEDCPKLKEPLIKARQEILRLQHRIDALVVNFIELPPSQKRLLLQIMSAEERQHFAARQFAALVDKMPEASVTLTNIEAAHLAVESRLNRLPAVVRSVRPDASRQDMAAMLAVWRLQQHDPLPIPDLDPLLARRMDLEQFSAWHALHDTFLEMQFVLNEELIRLRSTVLDREGLADLLFLMGSDDGLRHAIELEASALRTQFRDTLRWIIVSLPRDALSPEIRQLRPLLGDSLYTLMVLALFLLAVKAATLINVGMLRIHDSLVEKGQSRRSLRTMSRIFATLAPILPWIALWAALVWMGEFIDRSAHPLLFWLLQPAIAYVIYRLLSELTEWLVLRVALGGGIYLSGSKAASAIERGRRYAIAAALPWLLVLAVQALIGHSALSICLSVVCAGIMYFLIGALLKPQQPEVIENVRQVAPASVDGLLDRLKQAPLSQLWLALLLPLALANFIRDDLNNLLQDFDWYRSFSASLFRFRTSGESSQQGTPVDPESGKASEDYSAWFMDPALVSDKIPYIDCGLASALRKPLDQWIADHHQYNTLLLRGERGIGKTTTLQRLAAALRDELPDFRIETLEVPKGCWQQKDIQSLFEDQLGLALSEGPHCLKKIDNEDEPRIVIVDDAENLFRASVGGLEGWRYFLSLTNVRMENLYWVISINQQSFAYLSNVFGAEYQFASIVQAKRWSQQEIRSLILSRNHIGRMQVTYEDVLLSGRGPDAGNLRSAEQRYFGLLWDACRGNPEVALSLWLDSVSVTGLRVKAGLPRHSGTQGISKIGDSQQFVYAAIVVHGSLTSEDLCEVSSLPEPVIRHALKAGLEAGFLERLESGLYAVTAGSYQSVIAHLGRKNMLHE